MNKQIYSAIALLLFVSLSACASSKASEGADPEIISSKDIDLETHFALEQKWLDSGVDSYEMTVSYNAFSPMKGLWKITVIDGVLVSWEKDNLINRQEYKLFAQAMTQKNLYKKAIIAYVRTSNFIINVIYNAKDFHIVFLGKGIDPDSTITPKKDTGYSILITDFKLLSEQQ